MHPVDRRLLARSMRREMKGLSKAIRLTMNTKTSVRAYYYILRTDIAINKQNSSSCFEHASDISYDPTISIILRRSYLSVRPSICSVHMVANAGSFFATMSTKPSKEKCQKFPEIYDAKFKSCGVLCKVDVDLYGVVRATVTRHRKADVSSATGGSPNE